MPRGLLALMLLWGAAGVALANPPRYVARMLDGQYVEGNGLTDWHASDKSPKLDGQPLLSEKNPLVWLLDRSLPVPVPPAAYVELFSGDRLPGRVEAYRTGQETVYHPLPPHFLVRRTGTNPISLDPEPQVVRVDARFVRRIVWRRQVGSGYVPQQAWLDGGTAVPFRSLRYGPRDVALLTERGIRRVSFGELAELHLAAGDFWSRHFDELASLTPAGDSRLLQLETRDGLVATTSMDRFLARSVGDPRDVSRWIQGLQPAWSLDVIWVPPRNVWMRRAWSADQVPLSRVPPTRTRQQSTLGEVAFPAQINRNVEGQGLRTARRESGWGIGVHALSEMEFELPGCARALRTEFAIDAAMHDGGCVRPRILRGSTPLFDGPILVGSESIVDTGEIALGARGGEPRTVTFQVDPVLDDRPAGADPLDVRDHANWLEPLVLFDKSELDRELSGRAALLPQAWRGWTPAWGSAESGQWDNYFVTTSGSQGQFERVLSVTGQPLVLSRETPWESTERWLVVDAMRCNAGGAPVRLSVRIANGPTSEHELPVYDANRIDYRPIVLSLTEPAASAAIEIRQLPTASPEPVWWRTVALTAQHPLVHCLYEDTYDVGESGGVLDDKVSYSGRRSLRWGPGSPLRLAGDRQPISIRERPQLGEFRFLRMVVRKQGGGGLGVTLEQALAEKPARYEAGANPPADPRIKRLASVALKDEWLVITRDLYSDFGNLELMGLTLDCQEGSAVWIDHIYLARTQGDFELIKTLAPTR